MKIKHHEIEIPQENPFANCKLAREPYARVLSDIVNTYADGFVLAINNEWGTGKTTFVKMWQQQLKNEGFQTIYFNAWENDFDSNPLVALMSELETLTNAKNKKVFKSVVEKGAVLVKNIAPALAKSLIKKYVVDMDDIAVDAIENATKASTEILEEEIKEYTSKKKTIVEFRKELEKFVKQADKTKPLIFIVDELDRCRPTYAVEVLEQIKHFFSVSGIVFVLSIDKAHLGAAVNGFYGSEKIDSNEYLRRFIDLEYSIPPPSTELYCDYLFDYYSFDDFFLLKERRQNQELNKDGDHLLRMAKILFEQEQVKLRQQERIFGLTRLVLSSFKVDEYTFSYLLFFLIYLKVIRTDIYEKIENNRYSLQELSNTFEDIFLFIGKISNFNLVYIQALLIFLYNNSLSSGHNEENLYSQDIEGNINSDLKSRLDYTTTYNELAKCFIKIDGNFGYRGLNINFLLKKINLTESINIISE